MPGLRIGNSSSLTVTEILSRVPSSMLKIDVPTKKMAAPTKVNDHASTMVATLKLHTGVSLKISWVLERVRDSKLAKSLWMSVMGLQSVRMPIGGLLGWDGHDWASTAEATCTKAALQSTRQSRTVATIEK